MIQKPTPHGYLTGAIGSSKCYSTGSAFFGYPRNMQRVFGNTGLDPIFKIRQGEIKMEIPVDNPQPQIRLIIADDMLPIREYLSMVLSHEPDMKVIDSVGTGAEAVERALVSHPKVLLMDIEMETPRAGVDAIRTLAAKDPNIHCVVLTHFSDDDTVFAAFEAGAVDYVLKDSSAAEILEAVRAAAQNMSPLRPRIARMIREEFRALRSERSALVSTLNIVYQLTPSELWLLRLLAEGKTRSQIAGIKHIEPSTIRTHIANILKKFDESSVNDVVERLRRLGIFDIFTSNH
jgi:DNA-binding NarL/FixJ family response regulator